MNSVFKSNHATSITKNIQVQEVENVMISYTIFDDGTSENTAFSSHLYILNGNLIGSNNQFLNGNS